VKVKYVVCLFEFFFFKSVVWVPHVRHPGSLCYLTAVLERLWWFRVNVLPLSTEVRGFKPSRSCQDFSGWKNPRRAFLRRGGKGIGPMCLRFAARKRSLNVTCNSEFRQNYWPAFSPTVPPFAARISCIVWTWRRLVAEVGTSKPGGGGGVQGRTISLIGCSASGAYAPDALMKKKKTPILCCFPLLHRCTFWQLAKWAVLLWTLSAQCGSQYLSDETVTL
jgi:hypothetical protein